MSAPVVDLSLPAWADLAAAAGVDPAAEAQRVAVATPGTIRAAGTALRSAGGELDTAWTQSTTARGTIGAAFTNNGAPVLDRATHEADLPAGFADAGTRLAAVSDRLDAVATELDTARRETATAVTGLQESLTRMRTDWAERVAAAGTLDGGLIPESEVPGLIAERDRIAGEMRTRVAETGRTVTARVMAYEDVLHQALRTLADQGFVPPDEQESATLPPPVVAYAGGADPTGFGTPLLAGYAADPVNTALGNFVEVETDLPFEGLLAGLTLARTYNSRSDRTGAFGPRWSSWATARLVERAWSAEYEGPDGQRVSVPRDGAAFGRVPGLAADVERAAGGLALRWSDGRRWLFDAAGRLTGTSAGPGTAVALEYDDQGRLVALVHERGRAVWLRWGGDRVVGADASDGRSVGYRYDGAGHLVAADSPAGERRYEIDGAGLVAAVVDADEIAELVNTYDAHGRVATQRTPFGRLVTFTYADGAGTSPTTVVTDDAGGPRNVYEHDAAGRLVAGTDGHGHTFRRRYGPSGDPVELVARGGAVTRQAFDHRSRLVRRVSPTGAVTDVGYDDADRVVAVTVTADGGTATTRLRYEGAERVPAEIVDAEGGVTRLTVDGGLVHAVTDPDGVTVRFTHDADGLLVAATDAAGRVARIERDGVGRVVATVTPAGRRTELVRDGRGRVVARRDPSGAEWRREYSPAGRLVATVDPLGARAETAYGPHGVAVADTDPLGAVTARTHDVLGNLAALTEPDGAKWTLAHDALCRVSAVNDPAGGTWLREHDADGRLVAATDPEGVRTTAEFGPDGRLTATGDGVATTAHIVDALGRTVARLLPDGGIVRTVHDRLGRRVRETGPDGGTTVWEWSPAGRLRSVTSPAGRVERLEHDATGRVVARVDGSGRRTEQRHDPDGLVVERVSPSGLVERIERDACGRVVAHRVPGRAPRNWTHDAAGRVVARTDRSGRVTVERDAAGRAVAVTDALGATTRYAHDERGALVAVTDPLGATTRYDRDEAGRVVAVTDPLGRTTRFRYGAAGRLRERVEPGGTVHGFRYDAAGRVAAETATAGGRTVTRTWKRDAAGRAVRVAESGDEVFGDALPVALRWDAAGRPAARTVGGRTVAREYDADGLVTAVVHPDGTRTGYARDGAGRIVAIERADAGRVVLDRDADGRLVAATGAGVSRAWTWRNGWLAGYRCGERDTRLVRDPLGRVVADDTGGRAARYSYDAAGQLTGALTAAGEWTFGYDAAGRLTHEDGPAGARRFGHDAAGQLAGFAFDGAGRRTGATEWDAFGRLRGHDGVALVPDALGELAIADRVPLSWDVDGALVAAGDVAVAGPGEPWLLAGPGGVRAPAADRHGSLGDGGGDPWGGAGAGVGLGYRGEVGVAGLVWLRARAYDPATRSFLSVDPLEPVPGTAYAGNPYHYAGNDPVNALDPSGLRPMTDEDAGGGWLSDLGHGVLDLAGLIPVVGEVADLANAGWYAAEGDYLMAGLSAAAAVPFAGWAASALKGARSIDEAADALATAGRGADDVPTVTIYRNVDVPEFDSIASTGRFDMGAGAMEGKFFAYDGNHADQWGRFLNGREGLTVQRTVPRSAVDQAEQFPGKHDGIGPAVYLRQADLDAVNASPGEITLWP